MITKWRRNPAKYQSIFLRDNVARADASVKIGEVSITSTPTAKLLGVQLDEQLNFNSQVKDLCRKAGAQLNVLQSRVGHEYTRMYSSTSTSTLDFHEYEYEYEYSIF